MTDTPRDSETPLESWKAIAAYLQREVRTVRRWEKTEGLPVHRHEHLARSTVYAYPSELDAWRESRKPTTDTAAPRPRIRTRLVLAAASLLALASAGGGRFLGPMSLSAQDGLPQPSTRLVTTINGRPVFPFARALSPDERRLVFNAPNNDLVAHDLTAGQTTTLVPAEGNAGYATFAAFSPDGRQLAYSWDGPEAELRIRHMNGAPEPRTLLSRPDVVQITAFDWSVNDQLAALVARRDGTLQLALVNTTNGDLTPLRSTIWGFPGQMEFSPDGRHVAVDLRVGPDTTNRDVFVIAVDGSGERVVAAGPTREVLAGWAPDGSQLIFESNRGGSSGLWSVRIVGGDAVGDPVKVMGDLGAFSPVGITQPGHFYYRRRELPRELVKIARLDFGADRFIEPFTDLPGAPQGYTVHSPDFSPDGRYLATQAVDYRFAGEMPDQSPRIVIHDLDRGRVHRDLPIELAAITHLRWAPDNRRFVVSGSALDGRSGLFFIDVDDGAVSPVMEPGPSAGANPEWSENGQSLYFSRRAGQAPAFEFHLVARTLRTGDERPLYRSSTPFGTDVSPDRRQIAVMSRPAENQAPALLIVPADGGATRALSLPSEPNLGVVGWFPDNRALLVSSRATEDAPQQFWRVPADGGAPTRFNSRLFEHPGKMRVHPDGRRVAIEARENNGIPPPDELWVLENFLRGGGR